MIWMILIILFIHWVADFIMQTHWQAANKSKNNIALLRHVLVYTFAIAVVSATFIGSQPLWMFFVLINGLLHFCTDYVTSRLSSKLFAEKDWHNFFVVIGFDQLMHQFTLIGTLYFFFS